MIKIDIDMPNSCAECPFARPDIQAFLPEICAITEEDVTDDDNELLTERPTYCPLIDAD